MAKITSEKTKPNIGRPKKTVLKAKVAKEATGKVKRAVRTAQNTPNVQDTSLSPVVINKSKQVQNDSVVATKTGRLSRTKTDDTPKQPTKSVEQVLDIREIKKQAQKIIQEKQNKALGAKLRVSPRKKENVLKPVLSNASQNRRNKDNVKLIQTISDGPTVSLLSQNKIIQKNLPKPLRHVQKQLLKETKSNKMTKKSALSKKNNDVKNQKIIQKLTKVLLKNKVLTKAQLNVLVQNKSDFKAITALVGLLKAKRKATSADDKKNKWRVCSKEEEEEEEEEVDEDLYEMEDDEDMDKDYVPPTEDQPRPFRNSSLAANASTPKQRTITPLKKSLNVKSNKNYTPTGYITKPNRLANGDMPLFPIDNIKKGEKTVLSPGVLAKKCVLLSVDNQGVDRIMESQEVQDESINAINALLKQTENLTPHPAGSTTPLGKQQQGSNESSPGYYCQVCFKTYKNKANLNKHKDTWLHKFQLNAMTHNTSHPLNQSRTDKIDSRLISHIKQEMVKNMNQQIENGVKKDTTSLLSPNSSLLNIGSKNKYILDTELNLSLVVDSLNLILTNDVEDDEDAYDTLQMAIGASDAEMEIIKQLASQTITTEYVYDNHNPQSNEGIFDPSESALLIEEYRHDQVDIDLETRALGCPSPECSKSFFGLVGLQTHIKYWHKNEQFLQRKTTYRYLHGPEPLKYVCFVCKEMFPNAVVRDEHVIEYHRAIAVANNAAKAKLVDAFRNILEHTLKKCLTNEENKRKNKKKEGFVKQTQDGNVSAGGEESMIVEEGETEQKKEEEDEERGGDFDEYDEVTLMGARFIRQLKTTEDGIRAYNLLVRLVNPMESEENLEFVNNLVVKLNTILGKVVKSSLLPISNQMIISSRQQHNVFNSDSRERPYVCPVCECRFITLVTRDKHFSKAHPAEKLRIEAREKELAATTKEREASVETALTKLMNTCESSPLPLNKTAILNELKIRMSKKLNNKLIGKLSSPSNAKQSASSGTVVESEEMDDEEAEMLAIEDEYLVEEEEAENENEDDEEMEGVSMEVNTSTTTPTPTPKRKNNLQQFIREVQNSIKGLAPPATITTPSTPPSTVKQQSLLNTTPKTPVTTSSTTTAKPDPSTSSSNFKCKDCYQVFIQEDELFHHTRLEHAEKTLLSKLNELKSSKQPTTHYNLTKDTISPIKPVQILTSPSQPGTSADVSVTPGKELAPLLTRKELQQNKQTVSEVNATNVLQRDGSCLIEFDKNKPVSVTSLETTTGAVASNKPNTQGSTITPLKPVLKTPLASKLVSQLCSALKNKANNSPSVTGSQSPAHNLVQGSTPSSISVRTPRANVTPSSSVTTETPDSVILKRGPRGKIDEGVKQQALALLQQLNATDNRRKKRVFVKQNTKYEEHTSDEEDEDLYIEEAGSLLTNSQSWKRVAEVVKDWNSSDEEEEDEEEEEDVKEEVKEVVVRKSPRKQRV